MSDPITVVLARVMADVKAVGKDEENKQQGFNFRGIDGVLNAVGPVLREHGVIPVPVVEEHHYDVVEVGKNRTRMREVTLRVRYEFHGPAGDHLDCTVMAEALDSGDKATSKCMSVAFRTALLQVLAIPTHDPDPDSQSYQRADAVDPDAEAQARGYRDAEDEENHHDEVRAMCAEVDDANKREVLKALWKKQPKLMPKAELDKIREAAGA